MSAAKNRQMVLTFRDRTLRVHEIDGTEWFTAADIAKALGYSRESKIGDLYARNRDEFGAIHTRTERRTNPGSGNVLGDRPVSGRRKTQDVRLFSLDGAHLLAMFSRTAVAKEFRRWVIEVLAGRAEATVSPSPAKPPALDNRFGVPTRRERHIRYWKLMLTRAVGELDALGVDVSSIDMDVVIAFARTMSGRSVQ